MQAADPMDTPVPSYAAGAMPSSFAAPMHDIAVHLAQIDATLKSLTKNVWADSSGPLTLLLMQVRYSQDLNSLAVLMYWIQASPWQAWDLRRVKYLL